MRAINNPWMDCPNCGAERWYALFKFIGLHYTRGHALYRNAVCSKCGCARPFQIEKFEPKKGEHWIPWRCPKCREWNEDDRNHTEYPKCWNCGAEVVWLNKERRDPMREIEWTCPKCGTENVSVSDYGLLRCRECEADFIEEDVTDYDPEDWRDCYD
ncbi:MAG: hypothetical protein ABIH46_08335 [Chloroflexota bacterium]